MIFGDINGVIDPKKDRSRKTKGGKLPKNVFSYMEMLQIDDIWRTINPGSREYTFFSDGLQTYSRLKMCCLSRTLIMNLKTIEIQPKIFGDHNPLVATWCGNEFRKSWRMNSNLLSQEDIF